MIIYTYTSNLGDRDAPWYSTGRTDHDEFVRANHGEAVVAAEMLSSVRGTERWLQHPGLARDAWHSDQVTWIGVYYPTSQRNGLEATWPDATAYNCAHCAYVEAKRRCAEAGEGEHPSVRLVSPDQGIPDGLLSVPELAVEPLVRFGGRSVNTAIANLPSEVMCSNCGLVGHNRRSCERTGRHYAKVGIEIEGRWNDLEETKRRADRRGLSYCADGSVRTYGSLRGYEVQTKPDNLAAALKQLQEFYPDATGSDCGMHVHVSFADATHVTQLGTAEFYDYFRRRWEAWGAANGLHPDGEFFSRLRGDNDYCQVNEPPSPHDPDRALTDIDRYHQLNFSAWSEHQTVECRLLPMFQRSALAVSAVQELLTIYEDWLGRDFCATEPSLKLEALEVDLPQGALTDTLEEPNFAALELLQIEVADVPPVAPGMRRLSPAPNNLADILERACA